MKKVILFVISLSFIACSSENSSELIHPTPENLESDNVIQITETASDEVMNVSSHINLSEPISTVGKLYGEDEEMFGFIQDVVIDSKSRIYYLDSDKQNIRVFNDQGKHLITLGGKGQGPGEFENARSLAIYAEKWLLVSNGYRIEVYDIQDEEIEFLKTQQFKHPIRSICIAGNRLFTHNYGMYEQAKERINEGKPLNTMRAFELPTMDSLFSFGKSYKSKNPMVVDRMSPGDISCNEFSSTVMFAFEKMPVLQGYSTENGELEWQSRFDDLSYFEVIEEDEGGRTRLTYKMPENNMKDLIAAPTTLSGEYELIQVYRRITPEDSYEIQNEVFSFILNSSTGEAEYVGKDLPAIIDVAENLLTTVSLSENYMLSRIYSYKLSNGFSMKQ